MRVCGFKNWKPIFRCGQELVLWHVWSREVGLRRKKGGLSKSSKRMRLWLGLEKTNAPTFEVAKKSKLPLSSSWFGLVLQKFSSLTFGNADTLHFFFAGAMEACMRKFGALRRWFADDLNLGKVVEVKVVAPLQENCAANWTFSNAHNGNYQIFWHA